MLGVPRVRPWGVGPWRAPRIRIVAVVTAAAAVLLSTSVGAIPAAQASAIFHRPDVQTLRADRSSADVIFLGARGSGESDVQPDGSLLFDGEGPNVYAVSEKMDTALAARGVTFKSFGITKADGYTADPVGDFKPSAAELIVLVAHLTTSVSYYYNHNVKPFLDSIASGVKATENVTEHWAGECPNSQLVLSGYSQGAIAVHQAEHNLSVSDPSVMNHVAATVLLADGDLTPDTQAKPFGTTQIGGPYPAEEVQDYAQRHLGANGTPGGVPTPQADSANL